MRHTIATGICALIVTVVPADASAQRAGDGVHFGVAAGVNSLVAADEIDGILGGRGGGIGATYGVELGYAHGAIDVGIGVELAAYPLDGREAMTGLAMPLEVAWRPSLEIGGLAPSLMVGYVRHGIGGADVDGADIPEDVYDAGAEERVGFLGNALRVGAALEGEAFRPDLTFRIEPVVDAIWFDTMSIEDEGDVSIDAGVSWRPALTLGAAWRF